MSIELSKRNIELTESLISNHKPSEIIPAMSESDREFAIEYWKIINNNNTPVTSYIQFGSNACGMNSYGFYKSINGNIYIISAYCNSISTYYNVDSTWSFLKSFEEIREYYKNNY
jgi:hypothetical protein